MLDDLTKNFFDTFGIEPKYQDTCTVEEKYWDNEELANKYGTFDQYMNAKCSNQENCSLECSCAYQKEIYPQITDTILLKLFCMANQYENYSETTNIKNMKERTLRILLRAKRFYKNLFSSKAKHNNFVRKVQAIFKESEQE